MRSPLDQRIFSSTPFSLLGKMYIQIGNAAKCEIAVMPADSEEDKELIQDFIRRFNKTIED